MIWTTRQSPEREFDVINSGCETTNEIFSQRRQLDDEELDSGDDEGRQDRGEGDAPTEEVEQVTEDVNIMEMDLPRHPVPESSDGEGYLLKIPEFLSVDPVSFSLEGFAPPTTDHHSHVASSNFSAYKTAQTTMRWRHSPSNPAELQSNARILRWSDGSLTLQLASEPQIQYEITHRALAPPQRKPAKPTPLSNPHTSSRPWTEKQEAFTYLASASQEAFLVRTTNKITTALQVNTVESNDDEALERLRLKMDAARGKNHGTINISNHTGDPEMERKRAEQAEKDMLRAQRRLEAQQTRERERGRTGAGRSGARAGGLSIAGLEDEGTTGRRAPKKAANRRRRNNDEYSDEEEQFGSGYRGNQDEYDEEDDFIARSEDEDEDAEGEDDDMDDMDAIIERREQEQQRAKAGTPKRDRSVVDEDADAEGEEDETRDSPVSRQKRRKIIVDDDDDE
jgi:RNA polymerase-associated protein LEO1